jgi:hypothetical protein
MIWSVPDLFLVCSISVQFASQAPSLRSEFSCTGLGNELRFLEQQQQTPTNATAHADYYATESCTVADTFCTETRIIHEHMHKNVRDCYSKLALLHVSSQRNHFDVHLQTIVQISHSSFGTMFASRWSLTNWLKLYSAKGVCALLSMNALAGTARMREPSEVSVRWRCRVRFAPSLFSKGRVRRPSRTPLSVYHHYPIPFFPSRPLASPPTNNLPRLLRDFGYDVNKSKSYINNKN